MVSFLSSTLLTLTHSNTLIESLTFPYVYFFMPLRPPSSFQRINIGYCALYGYTAFYGPTFLRATVQYLTSESLRCPFSSHLFSPQAPTSYFPCRFLPAALPPFQRAAVHTHSLTLPDSAPYSRCVFVRFP